jgi:diguanylate cyclase (GGDEF)-like protein
MLARYGGEEFCILLFNIEDDYLNDVIERIRKSVDEYQFAGEKQTHHITISIGACKYQPNMTADDLIEKADNCLYEAKESGRNCYRIYQGV